jgi:hypothetical protein
MTTIQDTLTYADGRTVNGQVVISWPAFQMNGTAVAGGQQAYQIVNGQVLITLYPNVSAQPVGMYYTATYELEEGAVYSEFWIVPNLTTVTLGQVRVNCPVSPSIMISAQQLTSGGAQTGQFLGWNGTHWVPTYVTTVNLSPNTIGLTLTSASAADLAVANSPATLGTALVLNVPDAGPTSRGVVTTGAQTFAGTKTFQNGVVITGTSVIAGYVPTTRLINTGYGLTGGGDLSADRTLSVVNNTNIQKVNLALNSTVQSTRATLNFIPGTNVAMSITDNVSSDRADIYIEASGGGGGGGSSVPVGTTTGDILVWQAYPAPGNWSILPVGPSGDVLTVGTAGSGIAWQALPAMNVWTGNVNAAGNNLTSVGMLAVGGSSYYERPIPPPGWTIVAIHGTTQRADLELSHGNTDANGQVVGNIRFVDPNIATNNVITSIYAGTNGTTANNRGAYFAILTKADGGGLATAFSIDNLQRVGIGEDNPQCRLEVAGVMRSTSCAAAPPSGAGPGMEMGKVRPSAAPTQRTDRS